MCPFSGLVELLGISNSYPGKYHWGQGYSMESLKQEAVATGRSVAGRLANICSALPFIWLFISSVGYIIKGGCR